MLQQFDLIIGHNILGRNSDFDRLSLMYYTKSKLTDQKAKYQHLEKIKGKIIDTYQVFKNQYIKDSLKANGIEYETNKLNDIAEAYLGKGKLDNLTGIEIMSLSKEKQLEYCVRDAKLALELLKKDNWEVVQTLWNINSLAKMNFIELCNADYVSNIGEKILANLGYSTVMVPKHIRENKIKYTGGEVVTPIRDIHRNIITLDCKAMYPTIVIKFNLSSETISNCPCCPHNNLSPEIMKELNDGLTAKGSQPIEDIWICQKHEGKFAELERKLIELKDAYAAKGEINKSKAMKLVANSLYGMFQMLFFKYTDQRIGWIITAIGRTIIKTLGRESTNYGLTAIYGDTDSIFLRPDPENRLVDFIKMVDDKYKTRLEIEKEWDILLIKSKKGYFGKTKSGKLIFKKIHGLKSDATPQQKQLMQSIVKREVLEAYVEDKEQTRAQLLDTVKHTFEELENNIDDPEYIEKNLMFSFEAGKPLDKYDRNGKEITIAKELIAINKPISAGERYQYCKIKPINYIDENGEKKQKKHTIYADKYPLNLNKYKEGLFVCIENILNLFDLDSDTLKHELFNKRAREILSR